MLDPFLFIKGLSEYVKATLAPLLVKTIQDTIAVAQHKEIPEQVAQGAPNDPSLVPQGDFGQHYNKDDIQASQNSKDESVTQQGPPKESGALDFPALKAHHASEEELLKSSGDEEMDEDLPSSEKK